MSGDVQPRKRKDKKKLKDDDGNSPLNDDVNIHVHKEGGTGGNICAKIVFFLLFSALIVLIGLIIKENQGLTELDEIETESRYSQIFEGWVDKHTDEHEDDHSPELSHEHDDHGLEEEEEEDDHYESEEENVEESEEEQSEETDSGDEDDVEDEDSMTRSEEETNEETEEEDQVPESEEENTVEDDSTAEDDNTEEVDEQSESQEQEIDETEEDDILSKADKDNDVDDDEDSKEEEQSKEQSREESKDEESSEQGKVVDKSEEDVKETISKKDASGETLAATKEESKTEAGGEKILIETPEKVKPEEKANSEPVKPSSGLATKIGVGVALLVVAYNVFLRKRSPEKPFSRTISEKEEPTPVLSRRNTLVPPPSLQEIEADLPENERGEEEEYSEEEYSDEDSRSEHRSAREEYQELSSNYTRALTPEGNFEANKTFEDEILEHDDDIEEDELEEEEEVEELDDEEIEDDYDNYDEDEDEELLKRLEAKYGKLGRDVNVGEEAESDSDKEGYEHSDITNKDDFKIKADIDAAQEHLNKNAAYAKKMFEALLDKYPHSPRTLYGKAKSLDILAEQKQSNELLQQAMDYYMMALNAENIPDPLFVIVAERYIDRARFIGQYKKAIAAHWQLIERIPEKPTFLNNLAVTYLTINLIEEARSVLKRVLSRWPDDGFALVHYGFILKTTDNNLEQSVDYMRKGLRTQDPGVVDGRFYFHLGDALTRLNKNEEAMKLYEEGVQEKVFMSKYQRSLYNVPRLAAKPWWEPADFPTYQQFFLALRDHWQDIRKEGLSALNEQGYFRDEAENLKDTGTWKQLELFARGQKFAKNCAKSPVTCNIIQGFPDARNCRRGQTKFSIMHPGTHVWPHCGPTNCRLRIHLGLKVPPNTFIRVAEETRSWKEGDIIIFDDSFEHEVWHNGSEFRLVLIVDVWHPELTSSEKKSLSSI